MRFYLRLLPAAATVGQSDRTGRPTDSTLVKKPNLRPITNVAACRACRGRQPIRPKSGRRRAVARFLSGSAGQVGDGVAHSLARRTHRRDVRSGPQHLARHRGQQLPDVAAPPRPPSASGRPPWTPTPGTSTGPPSALTSGACSRPSRRRPRRRSARAQRSRLTAAAWSTISWATVRPPVRARCTRGALRVGGRRQHEHPAAVRRGAVQQRPQRAEPQVGRGRHGVGGQRRVARPGGGVGRHRRPDVAALGVGQHQHAGATQRGDGVFQHRDTRPRRRPRRTPPGA